jgi:uncharacterized protein (TIGR02246 family)
MAFTGPEADRMAIRDLHDTYGDAASRMDKQQWLDCWAPDGVWVTAAVGEVRGHEALAQTWDRLFETMDAMAFFVSTGAISVTGDTATARCHVREIGRINGKVMKFSARYDDELVRIGGRWLFSSRTYVMNIAE